MQNPEHKYLEILDGGSPEEIIASLKELLEAEEYIFINFDETGALPLAGFGSLGFTHDCPSAPRSFFEWWAEEFSRRSNRKKDELTSLISRSFWERQLRGAVQADEITALAMLDIDHFKRFNDQYGHQVGDRVLGAVGRSLIEKLPESALAIRYGGEEIMVVFPETGYLRARKILENFRSYLSAGKIYSDQPEIINISIGLARSSCGPDLDGIIRCADLALYESKTSGRDRLTEYAPYLTRHNKFYIWGIYRYLWGNQNRFIASKSQLLINMKNNLFVYSWTGNSSKKLPVPGEFNLPLRTGASAGKTFFVIDDRGELWKISRNGEFELLTSDSQPPLVSVTGEGGKILYLGVNNQLYDYRAGRLNRKDSMPDDWDQFCTVGDRLYFLAGSKIFEQGDLFSSGGIEIPEEALQITSGGSSLYLLGRSGRVFCFQVHRKKWSKLQFVNSRQELLVAREISAAGKNIFIRDSAGRLLFCRPRSKAVPQQMDIV
jgi:diguanylate cyclase (GGDEF)-like protein